MTDLPWTPIAALASTGILMALVSCLVGMRPKVENPAWWALYAVWIAAVVILDVARPFPTLLVASTGAGFLHGTTTALLLDRYRASNPWHAERTQGPRGQVALRFVVTGVVVGAVFGAIVGGIAWGLARL